MTYNDSPSIADNDATDCEQVRESNPEPLATREDSKRGAGRKRAPTANEQVLTNEGRPGYSLIGTAQAGVIPASVAAS